MVTRTVMQAGLGLGIAGVVAAVWLNPAHAASRDAHATGSVTQEFSCSTPIGDVVEPVDISAAVQAQGRHLLLKKVAFTFVNNFGVDATINQVRFAIPDPDQRSAPYLRDSAAASADPPGWQAGHQGGQVYELHKGDIDVADGDTVPVATLSAGYRNKGPKGTVVKWKAGPFSLFVVDGGPIDCTPMAPFRTIASFRE